jgi:hypothetical protein
MTLEEKQLVLEWLTSQMRWHGKRKGHWHRKQVRWYRTRINRLFKLHEVVDMTIDSRVPDLIRNVSNNNTLFSLLTERSYV